MRVAEISLVAKKKEVSLARRILVILLKNKRSQRLQAVPDSIGWIAVYLRLTPVQFEPTVVRHGGVDTISTMIVHSGVGFQVHLTQHMR